MGEKMAAVVHYNAWHTFKFIEKRSSLEQGAMSRSEREGREPARLFSCRRLAAS